MARPDRVIVVGAGPTGLAVAAEIALAGASCLVLERRTGLRTDSRAACLHARRADAPVTEPVTLAEVKAGLTRITGRDFGVRDIYWSGRYRSESRQVPGYRTGRIFLAGTRRTPTRPRVPRE